MQPEYCALDFDLTISLQSDEFLGANYPVLATFFVVLRNLEKKNPRYSSESPNSGRHLKHMSNPTDINGTTHMFDIRYMLPSLAGSEPLPFIYGHAGPMNDDRCMS